MEILRGREVDACFITGDVTAEPRASDIFRRVCAAIPHRDAIYTVLGNSEHKPWLDEKMLAQAEAQGVHTDEDIFKIIS